MAATRSATSCASALPSQQAVQGSDSWNPEAHRGQTFITTDIGQSSTELVRGASCQTHTPASPPPVAPGSSPVRTRAGDRPGSHPPAQPAPPSSMIATTRVRAALARLIFSGKQATVNPVSGSASRLVIRSICE